MRLSGSRMTTLTTLLPVLERAKAGSPRLDLLISYVVDESSPDDLRRIELFSDEGYMPERVAALLGYVPPAYTTSLDAAVPGENVVLSMYSPAKARWAAIHRRSSGHEDLHWGATEALARRIAALHAIVAADENGTDLQPAGAERVIAAESPGTHIMDASDVTDDQPGSRPLDDSPDTGEAAPWKILF